MTSKPQNFVYGLVDPRTNLVFYVGQTRRGIDRPQQHGQAKALKKHSAKTSLIVELQAAGLRYGIVVLEVVDDPKAPALWAYWQNANRNPTALHEAERWWIAYGRACGWPLTNETEGGQSGGANKGRVLSPETCAKMSAAMLGKKLWPNGRTFTEQHKANMATAARGRKHSAETKARMSAAHKGRDHSAFQAIGQAARIGSKHSDATKERMRAAWTPGRRAAFSEATRGTTKSERSATMSAVLRGFRRP